MTQSLKSTKYIYINDLKPKCQIFFSSRNNVKQLRQNTKWHILDASQNTS